MAPYRAKKLSLSASKVRLLRSRTSALPQKKRIPAQIKRTKI